MQVNAVPRKFTFSVEKEVLHRSCSQPRLTALYFLVFLFDC